MIATSISVAVPAALLAGLLAWRIRGLFRPAPSPLDEPVVFFLLVGAAMFSIRLPLIVWAGELNVDESQMLAQAMRYLSHPVPWRDVDGTTGGPLNSLFLSAPLLLGAPATWWTARVMLWGANVVTLVLLYGTLRSFGTRAECQLLLMPVIFFYAFAVNANFAHYSSETVSCLLISACLCLLSAQWRSPAPAPLRSFLLGLCAGAIPFAKLQAAPVALLLFAAGLALDAIRRRAAPAARAPWAAPAALCAGGALVPGAILAAVVAGGAFTDFWNSYILASASYARQEVPLRKLKHVAYLLLAPSDFRFFALSAGVLLAASWGALRSSRWRAMRVPLGVVAAQCLVTLGCFAAAGKSFLHYTLLLLPPLAVLGGLAWLAAAAPPQIRPEAAASRAPAASPRLGVIAAVMALQVVLAARYVRAVETGVLPHGSAPVSTVARMIVSAREPGDQLSVWGWSPSYHIETGLIPATRDAVGHFVVSSGPYQDYFRRRYLRDLERSRPAFFVDAVATGMFGWGWTDRDTHESFPELAAFIERNYRLWGTVTQVPGGSPVRLYVLESRAAKLGPSGSLTPSSRVTAPTRSRAP